MSNRSRMKKKTIHIWGPKRLVPAMKAAGNMSMPSLAAILAPDDELEQRKMADRINAWRLGRVDHPRGDLMTRLAAALNVSEQWLRTGEGEAPQFRKSTGPSSRIKDSLQIGNSETIARQPDWSKAAATPLNVARDTIPIRGRAMAGKEGVLFFPGDDDSIGEIEAPPRLAGVKGAYAVTVIGRSMQPVFRNGYICCVNPEMQPDNGDDVVIHVSADHGVTLEVYVKRLVSQDADLVVVEQFNPPQKIEYLRAQVFAIHRILWAGPGR